ncbi:MAG: DUF2949 domain-containing protein [Kovacikia sp.]
MEAQDFAQFMQFLQNELDISDANLQLALRYSEQSPNLLPIILWQYGLVTLTEVNHMFDWLEHRVSG